ncbi:P60-like protein [Dissoconium aciculare CBS 342.82]|uniref:Ribosome biogenesis protein NOP53 n=1 Tax=Dissoconium aciculare CBS 342.82 TaxID=1314786 RepID=A0A6J3M1D3_9PEZI|nr:P60-like protein [Dissoconium aciculare CBS 342.82]KAF1821831.1 P60-like protein [Dissoconium aciculare CBS 342.82]
MVITDSVAGPATHSQPSRKGKKAWRKNVDITQIEDGLNVVRDEIIRGGVVSEKTADQLFATDVVGDAEIEKQLRGKKLLRADEILAQRSAVAGLDGRKRKAELEVVPTLGKKQKNGQYISHKDLQRLRRIADNRISLEGEAATHDPWAQTADPAVRPELDFLEPPKPIVAPKTLAHAPIPLTASGKAVASVQKPEGGRSYNPLVGDWSALLQKEGEAAVAAEKDRLALEAAEAEREARLEAEAAKVDAQERDADQYATDYDSEWDGIQSEGEREVFTAKPRPRKTTQERNKVKARKEREAKEKWERNQRIRDAEQNRIKQIAKEVSARDKVQRPGTLIRTTSNGSDSDSDAPDVSLPRRRFGKIDVPDAPLEVVLPEDLQDSLRRLKPEGNLLTDRYRNLLINGKVEVRKKLGQQKKKQTYAREKWTYKDFKLK